MPKRPSPVQSGEQPAADAISAVSVAGYKSFYREQWAEMRPLTVLAGDNSAGKTSFLQPLLLWKQTLEASFDPGPLYLGGPHVQFSAFEQMISQPERRPAIHEIEMGARLGTDDWVAVRYAKEEDGEIVIREMRRTRHGRRQVLRPGMSPAKLRALLKADATFGEFARAFRGRLAVAEDRCFLGVDLLGGPGSTPAEAEQNPFFHPLYPGRHARALQQIIHLSGHRGHPARSYPVLAATAAAKGVYPGAFELYLASVVLHWQRQRDERLEQLGAAVRRLGLTSRVAALPIDDHQVELRVGRTLGAAKGPARDLVSLADVGYGVSQVLPVLVALLVARPGQLVYVEQPELHLHPRARLALAEVMAEAALRGVRVVAETHSLLVLLAVQTLVAEGRVPPELVQLHWFERDARGETSIRSADLDRTGAFGPDWPTDLGLVAMRADHRFLDAAEAASRDWRTK
ncbi:MAG TPA: AAA family ATPase [Polyangia bacterium]|nr:AAA family ATPase [Polyangia bacterium]